MSLTLELAWAISRLLLSRSLNLTGFRSFQNGDPLAAGFGGFGATLQLLKNLSAEISDFQATLQLLINLCERPDLEMNGFLSYIQFILQFQRPVDYLLGLKIRDYILLSSRGGEAIDHGQLLKMLQQHKSSLMDILYNESPSSSYRYKSLHLRDRGASR